MSYNITAIKYEELNLRVPLSFIFDTVTTGDIWYQGLKVRDGKFELLWDEDGTEITGKMIDEDIVKITDFGASSAYSYDTSIPEIIENLCIKYNGSVKMTTVWEGGDSIDRIEIIKGKRVSKEAI